MNKTNTPKKPMPRETMRRETMPREIIKGASADNLATEHVADSAVPIDKMKPGDALAMMLDNQAGAINALTAALDNIEIAAMAAYRAA
jgi:hypothetical protein